MRRLGALATLILATLILAMTISGCSSLGLSPAGGSVPQQTGLDYLNDDLGAILLALDVPETLELVPGGSSLGFAVGVPGEGERQASLRLVPGDGEAAASLLAPPAEGRTYFFLAVDPAQAAQLREAQGWARGFAQKGIAPTTPVVSITPGLCRTGAADPAQTEISVRLVLAARAVVAPLIERQKLSTLLAGGALPPCAGHSG